MQPADATTVLGDFDDARFEKDGVTTTFSRRDGRLVVRTEGPDGALARLRGRVHVRRRAAAAATCCRFPAGGCRRSASRGTRGRAKPAGSAGSRSTPRRARAAGDVLHWTRLAADLEPASAPSATRRICARATTPARDRYDDDVVRRRRRAARPATARAPRTSRGREARGASARRTAATRARGLAVRLRARDPARWTFAPGAAIAQRDHAARVARRARDLRALPRAPRRRSRDGRIAGEPLLDTHRPALLDAGLYDADGQIERRGLRVRLVPAEPDVRGRRHAAATATTRTRSRSAPRATRSAHSATARGLRRGRRITTTRRLGRARVRRVPHAHADATWRSTSAATTRSACRAPISRSRSARRTPAPTATPERRALGGRRRRALVPGRAHAARRTSRAALDAGRRAAPGAAAALAALAADSAQPAIVRATALTLLPRAAGPSPEPIVRAALADREPLVRLGAVDAVSALPPRDRVAPRCRSSATRCAPSGSRRPSALVDAASPDWGPGALRRARRRARGVPRRAAGERRAARSRT